MVYLLVNPEHPIDLTNGATILGAFSTLEKAQFAANSYAKRHPNTQLIILNMTLNPEVDP